MIPDNIEVYESNGIAVEIHNFDKGNAKYWLTAGIASIEVSEEHIINLLQLLHELKKEINPPWWRKLLTRKR